MIAHETHEAILDLEVPDQMVIDVGEWDVASVQASLYSGAWGTGVLSAQVSNSGGLFYGVPAGAVTLAADGITTEISVRSHKFLRVRTTTLAGAAGKVAVAVVVKRGVASI